MDTRSESLFQNKPRDSLKAIIMAFYTASEIWRTKDTIYRQSDKMGEIDFQERSSGTSQTIVRNWKLKICFTWWTWKGSKNIFTFPPKENIDVVPHDDTVEAAGCHEQ